VRIIRNVLPILLVLAACKKPVPVQVYQAVPVVHRDIAVTAQAAGAINPDTIVEVKSKASGEILNILVETGEIVQRGTLMVQIDRRVPLNDSATAQATLDVSKAQLANAQAQLRRTQELYNANAVTEQELESAQLAVANANATVVRNEIALRNAIIALNDTDVRAPITGTVIKKQVERGTVISSPTSSVSGGTTLLTMADLSLVQVKTFVDETDIGKLRPGLTANVTVNAYPNQPFNGEVLKIEPQGDTISNVTMFPVLIRIENRNDLLKPGMNTDVRINVAQRQNVLAVPNAALRTEKDVASAARVLGIADDDLATMMTKAKETFDSLPPAAPTPVAGSDVQGAPLGGAGRGASGAQPQMAGDSSRRGGGAQQPRAPGDSSRRTGGRSGAGQAAGSMGGGRNGGGRSGRGGGRGGAGRGSDFLFGGTYVVFALRDGKPTPVYVRTGLTDMDYTEVRAGLQESDSVLMLPSASFLANQERMAQRMGRMGGLPGQTTPTTTTTPGAAGGRTGGGGGGGGFGGGPGGGGGRGG
jgi:HlyD family secretion protein